MCTPSISLGSMINAGMLLASSRRPIFDGLVFVLVLLMEGVYPLPSERK